MKLANSLMTILIATTFAISGCMQQESEEMQTSDFNQYSNLDPSEGDEQDTLLEVNLGGASRAERFLGSYDEIERLALDVVRNYGNKQVVTDLVLTPEGGSWNGTVPKLFVGFDYTIPVMPIVLTIMLVIAGLPVKLPSPIAVATSGWRSSRDRSSTRWLRERIPFL